MIAIWIAIGVILSLYLLGKFQLSHDSKPERIGAFRLVSAIVSLAISFYLLTGFFGAKLGELEAFLPPELDNRGDIAIGGKNSGAAVDNQRLRGGARKGEGREKTRLNRFHRLYLYKLPLDGGKYFSETRGGCGDG